MEKLEIFNLKGKSQGIQERTKFYADIKREYSTNGKISKKVNSVRLILMNSQGRIYLQKRSNIKNENPGLYDKTVGGHVSFGESWNMAIVRECAEELGIPASILTDKEFKQIVKTADLKVVGIFKNISVINDFESVRVNKDGSKFVQPYISAFYVGYYDGAIRFVDGESSGVEVFSLKELTDQIKQQPEKFNEDIKYMVNKFRKFFKPIK